MSLLITPTLMDSHDWLKKCPQSWKEKAYNDLLNTLRRAPWTPNKAVQQGIKFEKFVYHWANQKDRHEKLTSMGASEQFIKFCDKMNGFLFDQKGKAFVKIDECEYCLYGRYDGIKPKEIIKDIKTTKKFKQQSYIEKWQHKFYTYIEKIKLFSYEIVEWKDADNDDYAIGNTYTVSYEVQDFEANKKEIIEKIKDFISFINDDKELKDAYYNKYNLY